MTTRRELPRLTDRLGLGEAGLQVSPICLGVTADPRVVPAAFEAGINFFFISADLRWPLYEGLRAGLRLLLTSNPSARDRIVIAAAGYVTRPAFCSLPFKELLGELPELARIDVTVAGGSYSPDLDGRLASYEQHRRDHFLGVTAIGGAFHDVDAAAIATAAADVDLVYVRYNPAHPRARTALLETPTAAPPGARAPRVYGFGCRTGLPGPDAYRFALTPARMDGLLVSATTPGDIRALDDALARGGLDAAEQRALRL